LESIWEFEAKRVFLALSIKNAFQDQLDGYPGFFPGKIFWRNKIANPSGSAANLLKYFQSASNA
jgi:hypothetical protein